MQTADEILGTLDAACDSYAFPMLDNGYMYLAATRLSLYRSPADWAMVIELFGFSPRAGLPALTVSTFASRLHDRDPASIYMNEEAYRNYLRNARNDDSRYFYPVKVGPWIDEEFVSDEGLEVTVRGNPIKLRRGPTTRDSRSSSKMLTASMCSSCLGMSPPRIATTFWQLRVNNE